MILCNFLQGRTEPILARLQEEMQAAAEKLNFEKAAVIRDQIRSIQMVVEKQNGAQAITLTQMSLQWLVLTMRLCPSILY
jgi:excinuclease UvrABC nuclease subunit